MKTVHYPEIGALSTAAQSGVSAVRGEGGFSVVHKFGRNESIGTSLEPISLGGVYQMPAAAVSLEFVSDAAGDALNGAGMHELTVIGLDASWNEQTVTTAAHATDGTTAVAISGTWLRVFRAFVSSSGTYPTAIAESHVGDITIRVASAGATWATISDAPIGRGQSEICAYTVPTGKTAYLSSLVVSADAGQNNAPDIILFQRPNADDVSSSYSGALREVWESLKVSGQQTLKPATPLGPFVGPCDLIVAGVVATSTGTAEGDFELLLLDT